MSLVKEDIRAKAAIYYGDEICQEKTQLLLREVGLPNGLLPLRDLEECGYVEETGFVWLKQKKKTEHKFDKIGKLVSYATEVTAYVEPYKINQLTGVKVKELLLWISLSNITCSIPKPKPTPDHDGADTDMLVTFSASAAGFCRTFPAKAFIIEGN
ncbi:hypothetical protein Dimus_021648 [Dionaea muscipula]